MIIRYPQEGIFFGFKRIFQLDWFSAYFEIWSIIHFCSCIILFNLAFIRLSIDHRHYKCSRLERVKIVKSSRHGKYLQLIPDQPQSYGTLSARTTMQTIILLGGHPHSAQFLEKLLHSTYRFILKYWQLCGAYTWEQARLLAIWWT